jgi:hypothetical protein
MNRDYLKVQEKIIPLENFNFESGSLSKDKNIGIKR